MSGRYFNIIEALTWIAFGKAFEEELYKEDYPAHIKPGWHGKESMKEFYCRIWGMSPEKYDARFIDFGLTREEAEAKIAAAEKELIAALSDKHSNIRVEGREDDMANGIPKEIPPNYFRAKITLLRGGGEIGEDDSALEDMFPGPHVRRAEIPTWYGAEFEKEAVMKRWPRGVTAAKASIKTQNECGDWLVELMKKPKTKEFSNQGKVRDIAIEKFKISKESFKTLWTNAKLYDGIHDSWLKRGPVDKATNNSPE
ncbi:hypothetical protein [Sneathiella sp.]|uniref:hypothetical protein n=1 Tax=Sneathiella sp. TaxID=1964365 RepID=UPI00262DB0FC|nr:hypothetical protein [Sneathiella sp.]MDF2366335.1 hypothetical protein [Sneathiella sp.]